MKKTIIYLSIFFLLLQLKVAAQQAINEEKVNKGVALMKKMMQNPGEMMTIQAELQALKLNSAEDKEMRTRMMKTANEMIAKGKQQAVNIGGVSEQQVKTKMEDARRILPEKNIARINAVLKRTLAESEIKRFCKTVHEAVKKQMQPEMIAQAEKFYTQIKNSTKTTTGLGNGAISCYLTNLTQQSIYSMGRVCSEENIDANNINNYAALLTNHGVEEGALPLLNYLNYKYPRDPVVLSNIAMAWLGLGDLNTAGKYADTCIRFFPGWAHQAHYVKSIEKEAAGDRQGAAEELKKSTGQVYSAEKEAQLRKWGGKLNASNFKKSFPEDALGLSKFTYPELPFNYDAHIEKKEEWRMYYITLDEEIKKLEIKSKQLKNEEANFTRKLAEKMIKDATGRKGYFFAAFNNTNVSWANYFHELNVEYALKEGKFMKELEQIHQTADSLYKEMVKTIQANDTYEGGEGQESHDEEICNIHLKAYNTYMDAANKMLHDFYLTYVAFKRRTITELVYAAKYYMEDIPYEHYKNERQLEFLRLLKVISYRKPGYTPMFGGSNAVCYNNKINSFTKKELARFEDIHCPPDWKLEIPLGSGVSTHCTKITLTLGFGAGSASYTEDLLTGEWTNMTLEIGKEIGTKNIKDIDVGAEAGAFIEIDRQGITDWGVKGSVGAGAGDIVQAGGDVKISMMCGKPSFDTKAGLNSAATEIAKSFK